MMPTEERGAALGSAERLSDAGSFALVGVACLTVMVGSVVAPGLPIVARHLGIMGSMGWLVTLPSLGVILCGPLAGWLVERQGAYRTLCAGLALYGLFGAACIWLHGPLPVFADRLLLGGATILVMAAGTTALSQFYEGDARLAMMARQGMAMKLGGVIFMLFGGFLAAKDWWLPFTLYLAAWLFLAAVVVLVPRRLESRSAIDTGVAIPRPAAFTAVYVAAALSMLLFFTGIIVLPMRLHALGLEPAHTGTFLSFVSLVAVGAALLMPLVVRATSENTTLAIAFAAYAAAHAIFAASGSVPVDVAGGVFMGTGIGLSLPLVNHLTADRSDLQHRGRNLARVTMAVFFGQFIASFMELIPGGPPIIFAVAAAGAACAAAGFAALKSGPLGGSRGRRATREPTLNDNR